MDSVDEAAPIAASFWQRVGGFLIDALVLGVAGVILGLVAFDALAQMGEWSRFLGFGIATLYFGLLTSPLGGGQTLGQRLVKLKVTTLAGTPLPLPQALVRGAILAAPFVVNGISLRSSGGPTTINLLVGLAAATALFGVGLAQLYLLVFSRPGRRLVHDLATGAAVVRVEAVGPVPPTRRSHTYAAIGIVAAVAFILVGVAAYGFNQTRGLLAELRAPLAAVEALPEVESATVVEQTSVVATVRTGKTVTHALVVSARLRIWPRDSRAEIVRLGRAVIASRPLAPGQRLFVTYRYGYDIGFGSTWRSYGSAVTP